jgi:UDP-N-acetylmuramoyl-tripeptide--D-alanyl-D-alanine ligase
MTAITLADIIQALKHTRPANATAAISQAVIDSRQVSAGALFVAIPGEKVDGHDYVRAAFEAGALVALIEKDLPADFNYPVLDVRPESGDLPDMRLFQPPLCLRVENTVTALQEIARFWRARLNLRVIGITGSVGKSTTKEVIAGVLGQRYFTLKSHGNLNNEIGLPLSVLHIKTEHERAVLEMGFYVPGEIRFLCEISQPHVGVITNIGTVHAERAGSQEVIARGKAELVESLTADGVAVLNYDDPWVREMAQKTPARVLFYGLSPEAHLWADNVVGMGLEGIRFRLHYGKETLHLRVPLIGRHSVHTALRAAAVGLAENLTWQEIVDGLQSGRAQLRLVAVRSKTGALMLDDTYNAAPESVLAALNLLEEMQGRKIAVLGDMLELGQYERQGHEMVGARAAQVADMLLTLGERAHIMANAARKSGMNPAKIMEFDELEPLKDWLGTHLTEGDVALVKGSRGLQMERIIAALEARA